MSSATQSIGGMGIPPRQATPAEKADLPGGATCAVFGLEDDPQAASICSEVSHASMSGQWEEARQLAAKLTKLFPKSGIGNFWLGQIDFKQGNNIAAVREFEAAVDLNPNVDLVHLDLGLCYLTIHQYKLFEQQMNWVVVRNPRISLPYYYLGRYYLNNLDQPEKASEYFQEALLLNPNDFKSRYHLGYTYEVKSQPDKAIAEYRLAAQTAALQKTAFSWPLQGMVRLYMLKENLPEALRYAQEAVTMEPKLADNHTTLGKLYLQMEEMPKGIEELKLAAGLDPTDSTPHYWLSRAYGRLRMKTEAEREQKLFLEIKAAYGNE
jgi:tetratricopeptide (TPR) repeat protein